jgi:transcriptional regulator with XRE-family HTH domain
MAPEVIVVRGVVATNLDRAITASGKPRTHVADAAGIARDVVFDLLRGRVGVGLDVLDRIAGSVQRPAWWLLATEALNPPFYPPRKRVPPPDRTPQHSNAILARSIRSLRGERGWSVRALCRRCGVSTTHTYAILGGTDGASIDMVARFAVGLAVDASQMLVPR